MTTCKKNPSSSLLPCFCQGAYPRATRGMPGFLSREPKFRGRSLSWVGCLCCEGISNDTSIQDAEQTKQKFTRNGGPPTLAGWSRARAVGRELSNLPQGSWFAPGAHLFCRNRTWYSPEGELSGCRGKELKGRTSENSGLSRVESVGRNLLKSDTLGKKPYAHRECGRGLVRSQDFPAPRGHAPRRNPKSQFTGNRQIPSGKLEISGECKYHTIAYYLSEIHKPTLS